VVYCIYFGTDIEENYLSDGSMKHARKPTFSSKAAIEP
jgi:hypothetical protein